MKKHDLPYMPFYIGDWFKAPEVRCLPLEAKGAWAEMLFYMWESTERGVFCDPAGAPYSVDEAARMLGSDNQTITKVLQIMKDRQTYSIDERGRIYCRRMVRDEQKRKAHAAAGALGGRPKNQTDNQKYTKRMIYDIEFEYEKIEKEEDKELIFDLIWSEYPRREGKKEAYRHFHASVLTNQDFRDLKTAIKNYSEKVQHTEMKYIKMGSTFFNNWRDYIDKPQQPHLSERKPLYLCSSLGCGEAVEVKGDICPKCRERAAVPRTGEMKHISET